MTDDRTLERAARSWLESGPTQAPDRAVDAALSRIQTIRQERDLRIPWRLPSMFNNRLVAAAIALVVVVGGGIYLTRSNGIGGPSIPPSPSPTSSVATAPATPAAPSATAATWHGKILVEHLGNAPDGSEQAPDGTEPKHRFYLVDPNNQTATGYTEFLPGQPASGKSSADVSRDGTKVVFQDWAVDSPSIYIANIDGTGFAKLTPDGCGCSEWDPAFNADATKVAYGHAEGSQAWLEILDLASGKRTKVANTTGSSADNVVESPSWSPDGTRIAFIRTTWNGQEANRWLVHYDQSQTPGGAMLTIVTVADGTITHFETGDAVMGTLLPGDPFFSPDGSTILFTDRPYTKMPRDPAPAAYTMQLDGTGLHQAVGSVDSASWTPDGKYILSTYNYFKLTPIAGGTGGGLVDVLAADNTENNVGYIYVGFWVGNP